MSFLKRVISLCMAAVLLMGVTPAYAAERPVSSGLSASANFYQNTNGGEAKSAASTARAGDGNGDHAVNGVEIINSVKNQESGESETEGAVTVASIGNTFYTSLTTAIEQLDADETLKLESSITHSGKIVFNKQNITLDLNGQTLTIDVVEESDASGEVTMEIADGCLTITDSSEEKNGSISFGSHNGIQLTGDNSKLTMTAGTLKGLDSDRSKVSVSVEGVNSQFILNDGLIYGRVRVGNSKNKNAAGVITINGGEIRAAQSYAMALFVYSSKGKIEINGGKIYSGSDAIPADNVGVIQLLGSNNKDTEVLKITGGEIISENATPPILMYQNQTKGTIKICDNAVVKSTVGPAIQIAGANWFTSVSAVLDISKDAKLEGNTYTIGMSKAAYPNTTDGTSGMPDINISGGFFDCGEDYIPIQNSYYVTYSEDMGMSTEKENGYFTLTQKGHDYQNFDGTGDEEGGGLNGILEDAEALYEAGNDDSQYVADAWNTFEEAYEDALRLKEKNRNANQTEINYYAAKLSEAYQVLKSTASIDLEALPIGKYNLEVDLYKYTMAGSSMADAALDGPATLEVTEDGTYLNVHFKPTFQSFLWGHMLEFTYFDEPLADAERDIEAEDYTRLKPAEGSHWYRDPGGMDGADDGTIYYKVDEKPGEPDEKDETYCYPGTVRFKMPYLSTEPSGSQIICRMYVDAMGNWAGARLRLFWSTLKEIPGTVEPTLRVSKDEAYLALNNENYKTAEVSYTLAGADGYTVAASSSDGDSAVVSATVDSSENKITLEAKKKGTGTVTVTATPPSGASDKKSLEKTIRVTVGDGNAVKVEDISVSGDNVAASVTGGALLPAEENTKLEIQTDTVTINAKSAEGGDSVKAAEVTIGKTAAEALSSKAAVTILTDVGDVKLDQAMLQQIAGKDSGAVLEIASLNKSDLSNSAALALYEVTLKSNDNSLDFESGKVAVTAAANATETVTTIYAYLVDGNELKAEQKTTFNAESDTAAWNVTEPGKWALLSRKNSGSTGGGSSSGSDITEEPATSQEFSELNSALVTAKEKLGDEADDNALITAAEAALVDKEISSYGVDALTAMLAVLEKNDQEVTPNSESLKALYNLAVVTADDNSALYESVDALNTAINSAKNTVEKEAATAEEIETASKTLRTAFASLKRTAAEVEGVDVNNLAEGTYQVPLHVYQFAFPSQDSMANGAIDEYAQITVDSNGNKTMAFTFKPMYLDLNGGQWGHLLCGWIYTGDTPQEAKSNVTNGTGYTKMTLTDYYTSDAQGSKIPMDKDPEIPDDTKEWPGTVRFTVPYIGTQTDYNKLYIRVAVDAMGGYNTPDDNSHEQSAIVVLDYTQIKKLDESGNPIEPGVSRTALKQAISDAENKLANPDKFTAVSANEAHLALTNAYAIRYKEDAAQSEVDTAAAKLQAAVTGLEIQTSPININTDYLTATLNAGVIAEASDGAITGDTSLKAGFADSGSASLALNRLTANGISGDALVYSISLLGGSGQSVQPKESVVVKIKIPDGWNADKLAVYHFEGSLNMAKPQSISGGKADNGFFVFETDSFSYFALVERKAGSTGDPGGEEPDDGVYEDGVVTFSAGSHGKVTATVDGKTINSGDTVEGGKTVKFKAEPNSGYRVDAWTGDVSGSSTSKSVKVDGDVQVRVTFEEKSSIDWDDEEEEDEDGISNGIYSVPVRVKKIATPSENSMANNAVSQYAKARVTSSGVTYSLTFKGMKLNGLYGHLIDMWYYDADDTDRSNPIPCDVDETYTDTDIDGGKSTFPRVVSFEMDGDPEDRIYIRVNVDAMNSVGAGEQDAILMLNWDDAEKDGGNAAEEERDDMDDGGAEDVEISSGNSISSSKLNTIIKDGSELVVKNGSAKVRFSEEALLEIDDQAGSSSVKITLQKLAESKLNDAQKKQAGDRPVYQLTVQAGNKTITNLDGKATFTLPYTLQSGEDSKNLSIWKMDDKGAVQEISCSYSSSNKTVSFTSEQAGLYVIAYGDSSGWVNPFTDVAAGSWYYDAVRHASQNGLFSGVTETTFAPNSNMTRAMLWTVLARYDGQDTSGGSIWYEKAMQWAMKENISDGTNPNGNITREQLAAILYRYAGSPTVSGSALNKYTDKQSVSEWAESAMLWAVNQGIVSGKTSTTLDPKGNATRAEVATMMMRFAEKYPGK